MSTRVERWMIVCATIAVASSWSLPAAADASVPARSNLDQLRIIGRTLNDTEMSHVRGAYSRVTVRYNGTTYTAEDPAPTGSVSLVIPLGSNTFSRVRASTTNGGTATSTVTISGSVTFRTSP